MTVTMKQGKEYKRRDGAKVTQNIDGDNGVWIGSDCVWRSNNGKSNTGTLPHDIVAEWPREPEGKAIAPKGLGYIWDGKFYGTYTAASADRDRASDKDTAEDKPKWGPWIGHNGRGSPPLDDNDIVKFVGMVDGLPVVGGCDASNVKWGDLYGAYSVRIKPVKGTVTITGNGKEWREDNFFSLPVSNRTHNLTFPTTDGTPITGTYTNGEGDVIELAAFGIEVNT